MTRELYGVIIDVQTVNVGEPLTADVSAGATVLPVAAADTFSELGGLLTVAGTAYVYTAIDTTANTITLATGLAVAATALSDRVEIYPPRAVRRAFLDLGGEESEGVWAVVPQAMVTTLADGLRDAGRGEAALVEERTAGELYLKDVAAAADVAPSTVLQTPSVGSRVDISDTGIRLYSGTDLKVFMDPATGQMRFYATGDLSHASTGHALQIGDSTGVNLALDNNEIMARDNGTESALLLNYEGGQVVIGGKPGGFGVGDASTPATDDHLISLRGSVQVFNSRDGDYADEWPPLLVGERDDNHLWFDRNEIAAATADGPTDIFINRPYADGTAHNETVFLASDTFGIKRLGTANAGIYGSSSYGADAGLQFFSGGVLVRGRGFVSYQPITASAFTINTSEERFKVDVGDFDGVDVISRAPGKRYRYIDGETGDDHWHFGPMIESLPAELVREVWDSDTATEPRKTYDVAALTGVAWEAVRQLHERAKILAARVRALELKVGL
jgi:hypothetical protein